MSILISIVTVTLNDEYGLKNTYQSILGQIGAEKINISSDFEWVVIDGFSSDGTRAFLKDLKAEFKITYLSEHDLGIFNAMNKGHQLASGKYVLYMNSGDVFFDQFVIDSFMPYLKTYDLMLVAGKVQLIWGESKSIKTLKPWVCHQSVFIPKTILKNNFFDEKLKVYGDLALWKVLKIKGLFNVHRVDRIVATFTMGGVGNSPHNLFNRAKERIIVGKQFGDRVPVFLRLCDAIVKYLLWRMFGLSSYYKYIMK